ncbi:unknown [Clostridium sp. CAG:273]|jgi:hypothetical protein|nr:hypothetical protein [Clostridia bacterium]CDE82446.1 unknown [Clostridium sp. CAG:273]
MNWIKRILNKFLKKDNIKLIEEPRKSKEIKNSREDFVLSLVQNADLERNDGNGYKINSNVSLKDMI